MGERFIFHLLNFIPYVRTMSIQYIHICFYSVYDTSRKGHLNLAMVTSSAEGNWGLEGPGNRNLALNLLSFLIFLDRGHVLPAH